jgi:hypothetical protein
MESVRLCAEAPLNFVDPAGCRVGGVHGRHCHLRSRIEGGSRLDSGYGTACQAVSALQASIAGAQTAARSFVAPLHLEERQRLAHDEESLMAVRPIWSSLPARWQMLGSYALCVIGLCAVTYGGMGARIPWMFVLGLGMILAGATTLNAIRCPNCSERPFWRELRQGDTSVFRAGHPLPRVCSRCGYDFTRRNRRRASQ